MTLRNWLLACALSPLYVAMANATNTEFDPTMLMTLPNQPIIDISRFNQHGAIVAGTYRLDVYVNDEWRGLSDVLYVDDTTQSDKNATLCVQDTLLKKLDTKPEISKQLTAHKSAHGCYNLAAVIQDIRTHFDVSSMRLDIHIPQIYVSERPDDYMNPDGWDKGVNSAFAGYQFHHYYSNAGRNNTYLGLNTGVNWNGWYFRHQGAARDSDGQSPNYQALNTYVNTAIPHLNSQLTIGDFYSDNTLFDGQAMRGVQMASDSRMLPTSLQGYAPIIRGFANSNATVSILQNNQEIYSTTVPAGAFALTQVRNIGSSGDLTVVITEADGQQTRQILPYHSTISLLRPNHHRYAYAFGRVRYDNTNLYDDHIFQGVWQQGLTNAWTANFGTLYSPKYRAVLLGSTFNTRWGAFLVNAINTQYSPYQQSAQDGRQIRLQYGRRLPTTKTNLNASFWWYDNHQELDDTLHTHQHRTNFQTTHPKARYQVSVSQPLGNRFGSLYGFFGRTTYHNTHQDQWQAGYSNRLGALSYGISVQTLKTANNKWEKHYLFNASLPFGESDRHHATSFVTHTNQNTHSQVGLAGSFAKLPNLDYGLNIGHQHQNNQITWSANANYQNPLVKLNSTYSHSDTNRQYSFGASGAVVAHQGGVTATNQLGDTFAIVHLPNGKGASLINSDNTTFNKNGYAILPNLSPYHNNTVQLNPEGLPYDVQLDETGRQVAPIANASVLVAFDSRVSKTALLKIKLANGTYPPMGASVYDQHKAMVGFVAQEGRVLLQNAQEQGTLNIHFDDTQCQLTYQLPKSSMPDTPIASTNAICR